MTQHHQWLHHVLRWFDADANTTHLDSTSRRFNPVRVLPFIGIHLACLGVLYVGISPFALAFSGGFFLIRMFAITGFYHRYFAHKTFKTSRLWQFLFAVLAASAGQRGPLWWAAHHRHHHQHSDQSADIHSPHHGGFWWAHLGWFTCDAGFVTDEKRVRDWLKFPELRFLNRFDSLVPVLAAIAIYGLGETLCVLAPSLQTDGPQLLVWGFMISTVVLFHATVSINSLAHVWGRRRFNTDDNSRNNLLLALITLGEGWHNNHHRWPLSARQGFRWYEVDLTYYGLWLLSKLGVIWELKPVPQHIMEEALALDKGRRYQP
ncbi:acyl-CoA desaturase [Marinobacter sp. SS21]|uniref:acyl-CoA desaturase n=1 Tax=Marinobacter sp. SS21 TaxID=2979460 RepID=UPI0023314C46|nr:acyl-CoA desaturase [Marinobacter sp. SS21]MDC0661812.1 acyl-CoA desaturase [Marinobacter sp. SS21]